MPSPFPGMDPYIEAAGLFEEFHSHFIERLFDQLVDQLPERYRVCTRERAYVTLIETEGKDEKPFYPDIGVLSPPARKSGA